MKTLTFLGTAGCGVMLSLAVGGLPFGVDAAEQPVASRPACVAPSAFGGAKAGVATIQGKIYLLEPGTGALPDFSTLKDVGSVHSGEWDISPRSFQLGFPGVTDRFEWFAVDYRGKIYVAKGGHYKFRNLSDDGAMFYLDGQPVLENDGLHSAAEATGEVDLKQGEHELRLSYFQGPRDWIALQLWVTPPGGAERIFRVAEFNKAVIAARGRLQTEETPDGIGVKLGSEFLFEFDKATLRATAEGSLKTLATLVQAYPGYPLLIEGHTDNVGSREYNQKLSDERARSVAHWLTTRGGISAACITSNGYGLEKPIAANDSEDGRQKNRRVEVHLQLPPKSIDWTAGADECKCEALGAVGKRVSFSCPPSGTTGPLWGTDVYSAESSICTAAVHAGRIKFETGGTVVIRIEPGQKAYTSSERNGVTSNDYQECGCSFSLL